VSVARVLTIIMLCWLLPAGLVLAQQSDATNDGMELIDNSMNNLLPIEGQRFRIDANVDEITLLFFREPVSAPLILIRPDGSKWYDSDYPLERVTWYTDPNFDMIKIVDPEPGPWQVAGRVDEKNKAVIVSSIRFEAEPLPQQLFENEQLKVEGVLYNGDERVKTARFRETVLLDVLFVSSNNPDFDNFGVDPKRVAEFEDNGQGYDEVPGDGVFTGRFALDLVPGEYIPSYQLETPLYERSFEDSPVIVEAQPITFEFELSEERGADNVLKVKVNDALIRPKSVAINGIISYPNGEERRFSVTQIEKFPHAVPLDNLAYGKHRVELSVFATSQQGREIELALDDLSFISVEPVKKLSAAERAEQARQEAERQAAIERQQREAEERQLMINLFIVVIINVILIAAAILWVWWKRRQRNNRAQAGAENNDSNKGKTEKSD